MTSNKELFCCLKDKIKVIATEAKQAAGFVAGAYRPAVACAPNDTNLTIMMYRRDLLDCTSPKI